MCRKVRRCAYTVLVLPELEGPGELAGSTLGWLYLLQEPHAGTSSSCALHHSPMWLLGFPGEHSIPLGEGGQFLETPPARNGGDSLPKGRFLGTGEHWASPNEPPGEEGECVGGGMSEVTQK